MTKDTGVQFRGIRHNGDRPRPRRSKVPAMKPLVAVLCLILSSACWSASASILPLQATPQEAVEQLLAADRAFGTAAANTTLIPALTAMFAPDVVMQGPGGMMRGLPAATDALKSNPANATAKLEWAPLRGGISSDGLHGFTYGYMTLTPSTGPAVPLKYLAYWIKRDGKWMVAGYKRRGRPAGDVATTALPPVVPSQLTTPSVDAAALAAHRISLIAAEKAFSDEAQQIGIGAAFAKHGWPDAMNMGGPNDAGFLIGNEVIGRNVGQGSPTNSSAIFWSADDAIVASSGDLGITFGLIRSHPKTDATEPPRPPQPFFTIWRKVNGVWKYIAE